MVCIARYSYRTKAIVKIQMRDTKRRRKKINNNTTTTTAVAADAIICLLTEH